MILVFTLAGLTGLATVLLVVPLILRVCRRAPALTRSPDLHHHAQADPVPRFGGLGLAAAFLAVCFVAVVAGVSGPSQVLLNPGIPITCLAMFGLGFLDDWKPLGARKKFLGQILIASSVSLFGLGIETFKVPFTGQIIHLGPWGVLLTVVWLVSMTNLINFIDGIDGLAAGISLMLMALLAYVGLGTGKVELLVVGMGGALLGFLCFNFPPARIYMGDGGAYLLGFQIGLFSLMSSRKGEVLAALASPLIVLALPILDTSLAILRRGLRGLPVFRADRRHLHHHLLETGFSHRKVVLSFYAVTLVFLALGMAMYWSRGNLTPVAFGLTVLILLLCAGKFRFSRRWFAVGRMVENSLNMRKEIEYAMCLSKWLALEGRRHRGVEDLWSTLVIIAEKLGFTSVKITLPDGERAWTRSQAGDPVDILSAAAPPDRQREDGSALPTLLPGKTTAPRLRCFRHSLAGGRCGFIELKAPEHDDPGTETQVQPGSRQRHWAQPTITDEGLFETISELLAEGWVKAAGNYLNGDNLPLLFSSRSLVRGDAAAASQVRQPPPALVAVPIPGPIRRIIVENRMKTNLPATEEQILGGCPTKVEVGI